MSAYACVRVYVHISMCMCESLCAGVQASSTKCKESPF